MAALITGSSWPAKVRSPKAMTPLRRSWRSLGTRADVLGEWSLSQAVMLSDEATLGAETQLHKACVTYHNALQMLKLVDTERARTGVTDGLAPPLGPFE